jgi:hypothetical protein
MNNCYNNISNQCTHKTALLLNHGVHGSKCILNDGENVCCYRYIPSQSININKSNDIIEISSSHFKM